MIDFSILGSSGMHSETTTRTEVSFRSCFKIDCFCLTFNVDRADRNVGIFKVKQGLDSSEERAGIVSAEEDLSKVDNSAPRVQEMNSEETCVFDNRTHACPENEHDRVQNLNPNKNNINKTNMSKTNPILSINLTPEGAIR